MSQTVAQLLAELGGVARWRALSRVTTRLELETAVDCGEVVRQSRGLYALPSVADDARLVAMRLGGCSR